MELDEPHSSSDSDIDEGIIEYIQREPLFERFIGRSFIPHRVQSTVELDHKAGKQLGSCARMHYSVKNCFMGRLERIEKREIQRRGNVQKKRMSLKNAPGGTHVLNTGYNIPLVGFGTYKVTGENVLPAIDAALTAGYRMFDTAKYYHNEKELGAAIKELLPKHGLSRSDIFITTKFFPESENSRETCRGYVEESLTNLDTNYIDMYLVHYPKPNACENDDPKNAEYRRIAYEVLEEAQAAGKIHSIGVSNYEIHHLEELKKNSKVEPCANQVEYHPHFTRSDLHKYCKDNKIFFQAFSSLARHEPALIEDPVVVELAKKHNTTVPLVLLAWALRQDVGIVPKSVTPARIAENFKVIDIQLTSEEIESLSRLDKGQHYIRCTGWLVK